MNKYKSLTNSMRHVCLINKKSILSFKNKKNIRINNLIFNYFKNFSGRNNSGHITVYTKSKRVKKLYRLIDFKRNLYNIPGIVYSTEYDPNRSSFISLIVYKNYVCRYILSVQYLNTGEMITSYHSNFLYELMYKKGDSNKLIYLPIGAIVHNIELWPNNGGIYIRSAGTYGKILKKLFNCNKVLIQLPSNSLIYVSLYSSATLGVVSNINYNKIVYGKAGRNRWLGKKPNVRGVAMNPVDHPHGGGEGKRSDDSFKKSPWGKIRKWTNKKRIKIFDLI